MIPSSVFDDLIDALQPCDVPAEYIVKATLIDFAGNEQVITGSEMEAFLANPDVMQTTFAGARITMDLRKIRSAMLAETARFFTDLDQRILALDDLN